MKQLKDIARDHGIELAQQPNGQWRGRCPHAESHPNGDVHPACDIDAEKNVWFCRTCNVGGGPAQYEQALEASGHVPTGAQAVQRKELTPEMRAVALELHNLGQMGLVHGSVCESLLAARALTLRAAATCGVGFLELAPGNGYGVAPGRYICFSFGDASGPTYLKLRSVDDKHQQTIRPTGAPQCMFLGDKVDAAKSVAIVEGEFDAVALVVTGFDNVISVPNGAGTCITPELLACIAGAPTIYIVTDNDTAGAELADKLARAVGYHRCRRVTFGQHKDANDALIAGAGKAEFQAWFDAAVPMMDTSWDTPVPLDGGELPQFPIDALGGVLGQFVAAVAVESQTPVDMAAVLALGAIGMCTAKHFRVRATPSHDESTNLYALVAMGSGNRKSGVRNKIMAPVEEHLRDHNAKVKVALAATQSQLRVAHARLKEAEVRAVKAVTEEARDEASRAMRDCQRALEAIEVPTEKRLFTTDATPEVLVPLMAANNGRIAIIDAEGTSMRNIAGRYANTPNYDPLLSAHNGDPLLVDRKHGDPLSVAAPALTIALAVQPEVIRQLGGMEGGRACGLQARFWYSMPQSLLGRRQVNPPAVPSAIEVAYNAMLTRLLSLAFVTDASGEVVPRELALSEAAQAEYFVLLGAIEPRLGPYGDLAEIADWAGKLVGAVLRLAANLHLARQAEKPGDWSLEIDLETFRAARKLGDYLIQHALAAFNLMQSRQSVEDAKYLKGHIERNTMRTFSARDLFEKAGGRIDTMDRLKKAIEVLVEHGMVRKCDPMPREKKAGRPKSDQYQANPRWICPEVTQAVPVSLRDDTPSDTDEPSAQLDPLVFTYDDDEDDGDNDTCEVTP